MLFRSLLHVLFLRASEVIYASFSADVLSQHEKDLLTWMCGVSRTHRVPLCLPNDTTASFSLPVTRSLFQQLPFTAQNKDEALCSTSDFCRSVCHSQNIIMECFSYTSSPLGICFWIYLFFYFT